MWKLLAYAASEMHDHVVDQGRRYAAVWVQAGDHKIWSFSAWSFRRTLHARYFENVDTIHVVHPSWAVRFYEIALWPIVGEDFWNRFFTHERVEFLSTHMDMAKLGLPRDVEEYDAFLDEESKFISEHSALLTAGATVGSIATL